MHNAAYMFPTVVGFGKHHLGQEDTPLEELLQKVSANLKQFLKYFLVTTEEGGGRIKVLCIATLCGDMTHRLGHFYPGVL